MELQQFVTAVIKEIIAGLNEASKAVSETGAIINPRSVKPFHADCGHLFGQIETTCGQPRLVHKIDFDVAVTASEGKETKGGIGIAIANIGLGTSGKADTTQSTTSRIKFSVPIAYPEGKDPSCP